MSDESKSPPSDQPVPSPKAPGSDKAKAAKKRRLRTALIVIGAIIFVFVMIPKVFHAWHTVSTDDAYVNSHVTFVAPRVSGQVARVLVDDNNRVKEGDVLVELDPEPFRVQVAIKQAAVDTAQANVVVAHATVRSQLGQARGLRFKLQHAIEDVDNQITLIRARVATWEQNKATQVLAEAEFERAKKLIAGKVTSKEEFDQKREQLDTAIARTKQALEDVYQARAVLGLPAQPPEGKDLTDVPPDLDQTFSSVRQALGELMQSASQLGVVSSSYDLTPKQLIEEFYKRDPGGDINNIYADIIKNAPGLKQAEAQLERAQRDLDDAKLNLRYCTIVAEIDGVVTRRNVNPGNNVQVGQSLMAVRSLRDIWVDANFKETQLRNLRIGQKVDLEVDMYGGKQRFEGRISGFTFGTGSTLALLPPQNATGNFVKVVQRLPVRVDLVNYDPDKLPLFVGLSVTPSVDLWSKPNGPNAGKFLQQEIPQSCACCIIIFCAFATLYANTVSLPVLLQSLFGYDATTSGLVLSPSGLFAIIMLAIVGRLLGRGVDARYLIGAGLFVMALAGYWFSLLNLEISPWQIVWPRVVFIIGLSTLFAPLNVAAFLNIPPQLRGAAVGLLALLRNEGGSVGTSVAQTIQERRDQFHSLRLGENLDQLNPAVNAYFNQVHAGLLQQTGDPVAAKQMALQILDNLRAAQSSALAFFDTFFVFAVIALALVGLVFLMKRSVAAKGAHVAAE